MKQLNLQTDTPELQRIKDYLEENASEILADKINNGTPFEKDGKPLTNKKNLQGFIQFASDEARKLAEKGARYACIEDKTVFGWAIHYFEEDSIEGNLFNLDGSEYKPTINTKSTTISKPIIKEEPKQNNMQFSLFDTLNKDNFETKQDNQIINSIDGKLITEDGEVIDSNEIEDNLEEEIKEETEVVNSPLQKSNGSPLYQRYKTVQDAYPDSVIAMRLGDFYEVFGDFAISVADELDLTLTGRDCGLDSRVPMCGFPYHCAENYFNNINSKHNLVIIETDNDKDTKYLPKKENKPSVSENNQLQQEREIAKAFDKVALCILVDIFGNEMEIK